MHKKKGHGECLAKHGSRKEQIEKKKGEERKMRREGEGREKGREKGKGKGKERKGQKKREKEKGKEKKKKMEKEKVKKAGMLLLSGAYHLIRKVVNKQLNKPISNYKT